MKGRLELGVTALVAVGAFAVLAVTGTTPTGVLAAGVLLVSAVGERRSLSWVLLAVALLLIGPASAVLAAAALSPRHPGDDLKHQGVAALRRIISAGLNPAVAAGAAFGAYRRGGRNEEMWWLIGWLPTMLASGLSFALWHSFEPVDATIGVGFAGAFLSLSQGPAFARTPFGYQVQNVVLPGSDLGRHRIAVLIRRSLQVSITVQNLRSARKGLPVLGHRNRRCVRMID